jgi:hypothetical protein
VKKLKKVEKIANPSIFLRNYRRDFSVCHKLDLDLPLVLKKTASWFAIALVDGRPMR